MKVTEIPVDPHSILGPADELHVRTTGPGTIHLSAIYADLEKSSGMKGQRNDQLTEEELTWYRAIGFIWEWVIERAFNRSLLQPIGVRPGEMRRDGIIGSPDLIEVASDPWVVIDTKATFKASWKGDNLEKFFWTWLVQLKGYCAMAHTTRARLLILFVCGTYKPPRPIVRRFDIEFTQMEVDDNWMVIVSHARRRGWIQ